MTRQEAIEILKQTDRVGCVLIKANDVESTKYNQESIEALNMAIKALEEQDTVSFDFELYQAGLMDMPKGVTDMLNKIRAEIVDTLYVDSLIFGELIDFKNGKISADDVIEEFNRVTRIEVLKIIDKYKVESEDKNEN